MEETGQVVIYLLIYNILPGTLFRGTEYEVIWRTLGGPIAFICRRFVLIILTSSDLVISLYNCASASYVFCFFFNNSKLHFVLFSLMVVNIFSLSELEE